MAAYSGLKAGKEMLTALIDIKNDTEFKMKVGPIINEIAKGQDALFELRKSF